MKTRNSAKLLIILSLVFIINLIFSTFAIGEEIIIVCNKDVRETKISSADLKKIFLGRKTRWENGQNISFVTMKPGDTHKNFLRKYIGKTESQFMMYWKKMVFTGKGGLPASFNSPDEIISFIAENNGAVAYLPYGKADDRIKILKIY